jgi:type IV secretion system protein VirB9
MRDIGLCLLTAALLAGPAQGAIVPHPSAADPRVQVATYAPDDVVEVIATLGFAVTVQFGDGERIETVSIGDSLGWQVTPNRRANILFLKPLERAAPTNMTVVTNLRTYNLELRARSRQPGAERRTMYLLKFDYPEPAVATAEPPPPAPPAPPRHANDAYSFQGSAAGLPTRVFDDGVSTYFTFSETAEYPAIFAVDPDNKESAVNLSQRDGFAIVDRLAPAFILRRGGQVTRIINDGYRVDAQPSALKPHSRSRWPWP